MTDVCSSSDTMYQPCVLPVFSPNYPKEFHWSGFLDAWLRYCAVNHFDFIPKLFTEIVCSIVSWYFRRDCMPDCLVILDAYRFTFYTRSFWVLLQDRFACFACSYSLAIQLGFIWHLKTFWGSKVLDICGNQGESSCFALPWLRAIYLNSNESYDIQRQINVFLAEKCSPSSYFQIRKGKRNPKFGFLFISYNFILARYLK